MVVDPNDPEHKRLIEKKIHKEEYEGQDLWKGRLNMRFCKRMKLIRVIDMVAAEERRLAAKKEAQASKA
jgi:hypothetical protein